MSKGNWSTASFGNKKVRADWQPHGSQRLHFWEGDDCHLLQMNTLWSVMTSIEELEHAMDSCRMELNEIDEVWPNLYIGSM